MGILHASRLRPLDELRGRQPESAREAPQHASALGQGVGLVEDGSGEVAREAVPQRGELQGADCTVQGDVGGYRPDAGMDLGGYPGEVFERHVGSDCLFVNFKLPGVCSFRTGGLRLPTLIRYP